MVTSQVAVAVTLSPGAIVVSVKQITPSLSSYGDTLSVVTLREGGSGLTGAGSFLLFPITFIVLPVAGAIFV